MPCPGPSFGRFGIFIIKRGSGGHLQNRLVTPGQGVAQTCWTRGLGLEFNTCCSFTLQRGAMPSLGTMLLYRGENLDSPTPGGAEVPRGQVKGGRGISGFWDMLHGLHCYFSCKPKFWLWGAGWWVQGLSPASYLHAQTEQHCAAGRQLLLSTYPCAAVFHRPGRWGDYLAHSRWQCWFMAQPDAVA